MLVRASLRRFGDVGTQLFRKCAVMAGTGAKLVASRVDLRFYARRAHALFASVGRKTLPLA
jgi:hypothetical protein